MSTVNFNKAILLSARAYAGLVTKLAKVNSESSRVKSTIKSSVEQKGHLYIIRTRAGGINARDARAREYGSGLHARRGKKAKYPIRPRKTGGVLVFPWDKASDLIPRTNDGRVILKEVMHPGIKADNNGKGYIAPAQVKARKFIKKKLKLDGAKGIRMDLRSSFKGAIVR